MRTMTALQAGTRFGELLDRVSRGAEILITRHGKPAGILLGAWIAVRLGARLPRGATWSGVLGVGALAGIGFTVALFVGELAYLDETLLTHAKVGIFAGSIASGVVGYALLRTLSRPPAES